MIRKSPFSSESISGEIRPVYTSTKYPRLRDENNMGFRQCSSAFPAALEMQASKVVRRGEKL